MNRLITEEELISLIAQKNNIDKEDVKSLLTSMTSIIEESLLEGENVKIEGLGEFKIVSTQAGAKKLVVFQTDPTLKKGINAPFEQFAPIIIETNNTSNTERKEEINNSDKIIIPKTETEYKEETEPVSNEKDDDSFKINEKDNVLSNKENNNPINQEIETSENDIINDSKIVDDQINKDSDSKEMETDSATTQNMINDMTSQKDLSTDNKINEQKSEDPDNILSVDQPEDSEDEKLLESEYINYDKNLNKSSLTIALILILIAVICGIIYLSVRVDRDKEKSKSPEQIFQVGANVKQSEKRNENTLSLTESKKETKPEATQKAKESQPVVKEEKKQPTETNKTVSQPKKEIIKKDDAIVKEKNKQPKEIKETVSQPKKENIEKIKIEDKPVSSKTNNKENYQSYLISSETTTPIPSSQIKMEPGGRLTLLALKYYGNKIFWVYIFEANKEKYPNPEFIPAGALLTIPQPSEYGINNNDQKSLSKAAELSAKILKQQ